MRLAIAVIPQQAEQRLVNILRRGLLCRQHGWSHANHGSGEFELDRPFQGMIDDILDGQRRMDALFGPYGWQRVFVPPYHRLAVAFKSLIPALGFSGVSTGAPLTLKLEHVREAKAELDLFDWAVGPVALRRRRGRAPSGCSPHAVPKVATTSRSGS